MKYLEEIESITRTHRTRRQLRSLFHSRTMRDVPNGVNLRFFVPRWWRDQQAVNAGLPVVSPHVRHLGQFGRPELAAANVISEAPRDAVTPRQF